MAKTTNDYFNTIELGAVAWREIINDNLEVVDDYLFNLTRSQVKADTTNFNKNLSGTDDTVQKRLETIDEFVFTTDAANITLDTSSFTGNLDNTIDTVQKLAEWIDQANFGGAVIPTDLLGGDATTTSVDFTADGGDATTTLFDSAFDGGDRQYSV